MTDGGVVPNVDTIQITVRPKLTSITVVPDASRRHSIADGETYLVHAVALDQFGNPMPRQPSSFQWTIVSGPGSINANGLLTATAGAGTIVVSARVPAKNQHPVTSAPVTFDIGATAIPNALPGAVKHVAALSTDGVDAQIVWNNNDNLADGFLIEVSTDQGSTFKPIGTAPAGATSFLATLLTANLDDLFRITPFNAVGFGPSATELFKAAEEYNFADGMYRITLYDADNPFDEPDPAHPAITSQPFQPGMGHPAMSGSGTVSILDAGWIKADSEADAVRQALSGSFTNSDTGITYTLPNSGAFRYDPSFRFSDDEYDTGPALVVDPQYSTGNTYEWNAAYVRLNILEDYVCAMGDLELEKPDLSGQQRLGDFESPDQTSTPSDFTAVITWADGTISPGTITSIDGMMDMATYEVSVPFTPSKSQSPGFQFTVTHKQTGQDGFAYQGSGSYQSPVFPEYIHWANGGGSDTNVAATPPATPQMPVLDQNSDVIIDDSTPAFSLADLAKSLDATGGEVSLIAPTLATPAAAAAELPPVTPQPQTTPTGPDDASTPPSIHNSSRLLSSPPRHKSKLHRPNPIHQARNEQPAPSRMHQARFNPPARSLHPRPQTTMFL